MSANRIIKLSNHPPMYPAIKPRKTPIIVASRTAIKPTKSETLRPNNIAEKRSLPWSSVPKKNISPVNAFGSIGAVNPFIRFKLAGSNGFVGAIKFANKASNIKVKTTMNDINAIGAFKKS